MDENLKKIQERELHILKEVVKVCDQLELKYSLYCGTMIGAIRHQGFIPWDDDIDIIMPREDYEIFLKKAQKILPHNLFVQHYSTEKNYNNLYMKIRDKDTCFLEKTNQEFNICHGIFIDIFPFDKCKEKTGKKEYDRRKIFNLITGCYSLENIKTVQKLNKRIIAKVFHLTYCKLFKMNKHIEKEDIRRKKINAKQGKYYLLSEDNYSGTISCERLFDLTKKRFEDQDFWCSKDYDYILTNIYGDYMKMPELKNRITHEPVRVEI